MNPHYVRRRGLFEQPNTFFPVCTKQKINLRALKAGPRKGNPGPSTFRKIRALLLVPGPYARKPWRGAIRDLSQVANGINLKRTLTIQKIFDFLGPLASP